MQKITYTFINFCGREGTVSRGSNSGDSFAVFTETCGQNIAVLSNSIVEIWFTVVKEITIFFAALLIPDAVAELQKVAIMRDYQLIKWLVRTGSLFEGFT